MAVKCALPSQNGGYLKLSVNIKLPPVTLKNFMIQYMREDLLPFVEMMVFNQEGFLRFYLRSEDFFLSPRDSFLRKNTRVFRIDV